jgi:O-antigen/teichoic acid export membrane protein
VAGAARGGFLDLSGILPGVAAALARLMHGLPLGFLRNLKWQYIASLGAAVLGGLYFLLLGRTLGIVNFGLYSLALSVATAIFNCTDMRLQEAAVRFLSHAEGPQGEARAARIFRLLYQIDVGARFGAAVLVGALASLIAAYILHDPHAALLIVLSGAVLLVSKLGNTVSVGVLRVTDRFEWTAYLTLADWGGRLVLTAALAVTGKLTIPLVLIVSLLISGGVNACTVIAAIREWTKRHPRLPPVDVALGAAELRKYIGSSYGISLSENLIRELDTTVVGWLLGIEAVAIYRMSKNFVALVARMADPVFLVLMPEFSRFLHEKRMDEARRFIRKLVVLLGGIAVAAYAVSVLAMPWIVHAFLGAKFAPVTGTYAIMVAYTLISMPTIWSYPLLAAAGRTDLLFRGHLTGNCLVIGLIFCLAPIWGVYGAAAALSLGISVTFCISLFLIWRTRVAWA